MTKLIKIYGERNTNTNYLSKLVELNLHAKEVSGTVPPIIMKMQKLLPGNELVRDIYFHFTFEKNLGWKHALVKPQKELNKCKLVDFNLFFLTITKNPYSWLLSLYRNPYHQYFSDKPSFEVFLKRQWKTIGRDNTQGNLSSPIELWNIKNRSYLQLDTNNVINITTESMFQDAGNIIHEISKRFSIEKKSDEFINYERSTKNKSKDSVYYRDYYLSEKWRENLSRDAITIINESIDKDLMVHFGYSVLP
ncbi:MAG: hypothetical protein GY834_02020 [Bacteroidetes bacterium]|nr:hypothetical protein [Bacteroidota bacterium]